MKHVFPILLGFVLAACSPAEDTPMAPAAGSLEEGVAAFEANELERAHAILLPLAQGGDAEAQYFLAQTILQEIPVPTEDRFERRQMEREVLDWTRAAADQGHANAMAIHGGMLDTGFEGSGNPAAALEWYERSARAGSGLGQFALAWAIERGRGVSADPAEAYVWYSIAAAPNSDRYDPDVVQLASTRKIRLEAELSQVQLAEARDRIERCLADGLETC